MKAASVLTETGYIYPFWNIDVSQNNTWIKTRPKVVYLRSLEFTCEEKEEDWPPNEEAEAEAEDVRGEAIWGKEYRTHHRRLRTTGCNESIHIRNFLVDIPSPPHIGIFPSLLPRKIHGSHL